MKKNINRIFYLSSMLVTTTLSFPSLAAETVECQKPCAKTCEKPCEAPKYFYFGAKAGIAGVNGKYQALDSSVENLHSARIGGTSGQFGLVLGANTFFANYFYTGLELDGYYDTYDHNVRVSTSSTGVKITLLL